jgi:Zn-dependent protease with chaperone function
MEKIELPIESDDISPLRPDLKRLWKMLWIVWFNLITVYILLICASQMFIRSLSLEEERELFWDFLQIEQQFDISKLTHDFTSPYDIYVLDDEYEVNAYALPWTIIYVTQGLLDELKYEEELIFILWHEMEHIKNRDVLEMYARDLPFRFTLAFLWFDSVLEWISFSEITWNYISQQTEKHADIWWIELINSLELNLKCSTGFFERIWWENSVFMKLLSTHPSDNSRIENIQQNIKYNKECTPLEY